MWTNISSCELLHAISLCCPPCKTRLAVEYANGQRHPPAPPDHVPAQQAQGEGPHRQQVWDSVNGQSRLAWRSRDVDRQTGAWTRFTDHNAARRRSLGHRYLINSQLHKYTECQTNDSPIEYSCRISRQKTALADTVKHTQAVSTADRVQCLALLVHTSTDS